MIDYEVNIFDTVYRQVGSKCARGKFTSIYVQSPTAYPAGSLIELSNRTVREFQSSTPTENFSRVMYQLDTFAMSKKEARDVYKTADEAMIGMGFTRTMGNFIDNAGNPDVYRYTARYEALIDPDGVIYRIP